MSVQVTHVAGGFVVAMQDISQLEVVRHLAGQLAPATAAAVVLDVSAVTLLPSDGAAQLVGRVREVATECRSHRWSLVAARLTARRILRQLCAGTTIGVYPNVDAALAAFPPGMIPSAGAAS